ncbi:darobactin family peptide antibiotic, partial [Yersinia enterocolitica]|nr:darobactin family peptide antibiotic [Yersinia enterocolitica]
SINDHEIENLRRSNSNNQITAWNWSKSFTQQ